MSSKGHIVKISDKIYRVGDYSNNSKIFCWSNTKKIYYEVENSFPYNDIKGIKPVILNDSNANDYVIFIFPEPCSKLFIELIQDHIKTSKEFVLKLLNDWTKIDSLEYKITYAFGGERINIIYMSKDYEVARLMKLNIKKSKTYSLFCFNENKYMKLKLTYLNSTYQ